MAFLPRNLKYVCHRAHDEDNLWPGGGEGKLPQKYNKGGDHTFQGLK